MEPHHPAGIEICELREDGPRGGFDSPHDVPLIVAEDNHREPALYVDLYREAAERHLPLLV